MSQIHNKILEQSGLHEETNDDFFWNIIEAIDWKSDQDYVKARKRLKSLNLSNKQRQELHAFVVKKYRELDWYVSKIFPPGTSPTCGAEDSYSDYLYSAVGHGKDYYNSLFDSKHKWDRKEAEEKTVEDFWNVVEID